MFDLPDLWSWVQTLTAADLPAVPFEVAPGQRVINGEKWLRKLQDDARLELKGPRAQGPIQRDLRGLYAITTLPT